LRNALANAVVAVRLAGDGVYEVAVAGKPDCYVASTIKA